MIVRVVAVLCALMVIAVVVISGFSRPHEFGSGEGQSAKPALRERDVSDRAGVNRQEAITPASVARSEAYRAPVIADQRLMAFVDRQANIDDRVFDDMSTAIPIVSDGRDVDAVRRVLKDTQELDVIRHEAANLLRRSQCKSVGDDLVAVMKDPSDGTRFRGWAAQHLGSMLVEVPESKERFTLALQAALRSDCREVQREALLALCRVQDPVAAQTADEWLRLQYGDEGVQDTALRGLSEVNPMRALAYAQRLVSDSSERVRVAAYAVIGDIGGPAELPVLDAAIRKSDESLRVRYAASHALDRIRSRPE